MAGVYAPSLKSEVFPVHTRKGENLVLLIHRNQNDNAVGTGDFPRGLEGCRSAGGLNDTISSPSAGERAEGDDRSED